MKDAEGVEGVDTTSTIGQSIGFRSGPLAGRLIRCASPRVSHLARPGVRLAPLFLLVLHTVATPLLTTLPPLSTL